MKESGYPGPIADKLNALRWGTIANSIRQKLDPRRSANNETMLNAAPELQELLGDFDAIVAEAQPTIEAARKLLAQFSPTVSKLAQVAAQKTKELQEKTTNPETSPQENAKEQEQVDQSIEKLQEALLEMATKQDILNAAQLQAAKDSDRALNMIDQVQEPMAQANQQLLDAQNNSQDANAVAQAAQEAAQKQQQAAETFETIAKHFERVEEALANPQPSNLAAADASRSQLQPKQPEAPSNPQNNSESQPPSKDQNADMLAQAKDLLDNYQKADQLSELAKNSPEELLKLLEAELRRNQPMQNELSDISKQTVRDAAAELQNASQRESNLAQQLENSDSQTMDSKAVQAQQL
jgi:DNA repair exonuclease SbcCD ATPase subunit